MLSRSICSGKYMVMVRGDVARGAGRGAGGDQRGARFSVIDSFVIPNLHEAVFPAISGATQGRECSTRWASSNRSRWPSLIEGADAAVKAANVQLIEIRLAMALGGKAFVTLTGNVAAVQSAVDAGAQRRRTKGNAGQ